jgi:type VI secretion system secreted protein Hcp
MRTPSIVGLLAAVGLALSASSAAAQSFDAFLLLPGIAGSSQDVKHKGWIDLISLSQSLGPVDPKKLTSACNMSVLKVLDVSGPAIWAAAATGQIFGDVAVEVQKSGGVPVVFYTVHLFNARVTSLQSKVDSAALPVEQLVVAPQSATLAFRTQNPDGSFGAPVTSTIDCAP